MVEKIQFYPLNPLYLCVLGDVSDGSALGNQSLEIFNLELSL